VNGETGPGISTEIERKKQADSVWQPVMDLDAGVDRFTHTGLDPSTAYEDRVRHVHTDGRESAWATRSFSTLSTVQLLTPELNSAEVFDIPQPNTGSVFVPDTDFPEWQLAIGWTNTAFGVFVLWDLILAHQVTHASGDPWHPDHWVWPRQVSSLPDVSSMVKQFQEVDVPDSQLEAVEGEIAFFRIRHVEKQVFGNLPDPEDMTPFGKVSPWSDTFQIAIRGGEELNL